MSADHVGRESRFTALGREWIAQRWERGPCHEKFVAWAKSKLPDPRQTAVDEVEFLVRRAAKIAADSTLSQAEKQLLLDGNLRQQHHAAEYSLDIQNQYQSIESPPVRALMNTDEGALRMMQIMLEKHHGEVSAETAHAILEELGAARLQELFDKAAGKSPPKEPAPDRGKPSQEPLLPGETSTRSLSVATPD
jgi:hypothetical protein